jgi:hypothetical protein
LTYTSGEDEFYAGKGDDTYNVSFGKNTDLVITDDGGSDVLNLTGKGLVTTVKSGDTTTSTVNLTALFNVDKSGNVALTSAAQDADGDTYEDTDSLVIIDKNTNAAALKKIMNGKASGIVEIDNYFGTRSAESEHKYALGTGAIENINVGLSSADTTAWTIDDSYIDAVASAVGSWLTANNYEDAMAVFASDKTDDIASLLNVYTTGTYTAPASDSTQAGA